MPPVIDSYPQLDVRDRRRWRTWLAKHHDSAPGVWLLTDRGIPTGKRLSYDDAVEEALCFGWIDSLVRKLDDHRTIQLFTPRKPKSGWSKSNKVRVEQLLASGAMMPAGLAKIAEAKRNGMWTLLDSAEALEVPPDLRRALKANAAAQRQFTKFSNSTKRMILSWIATAKKAETRAVRIEKTVRMAARGLRAQIDRE
jgi:uncharacterized protein YdeI (YjbR/CyaY-like superfamily)